MIDDLTIKLSHRVFSIPLSQWRQIDRLPRPILGQGGVGRFFSRDGRGGGMPGFLRKAKVYEYPDTHRPRPSKKSLSRLLT
jgi:hypothetical protein